MNGDEQGPTLGDFQPSWMRDGDLSGGSERDPNFDYYQSYDLTGNTVGASGWDVNVRSRQNDNPEVPPPGVGCVPPSADTSKIYVYATHYVDGKWKCYWLETTECP